MLYQGFKTFSEKSHLLENVQMAKDYLIKRYATAKNMKSSDVPEEVKQKIVNDPKFIAVRDLTQKFPNYAPLFTKFAFEEKASMEELEEIVQLMNQYKTNLAKDLEMPVLDYGKTEPTEDDHRPGYERLGDDLRNIPRKIKLRKLYNGLTPEMKIQFQKASEKEMNHLEEISNQLDRLPNKEGVDENGNRVTKNAWAEFTGNVKKYTDTRTYPEYRDPRVAFLDMLKDADLKIEKWDESDDEFITNLKKLGAQVGILYNKNGYTVLSARTPDALRAVAGDTNWCIRNDSTFWSYSGSSSNEVRLQLVVINKNLPVTSNLSLLGITVYGDGRIYTDADRPNRRISAKGGTFKTLGDLMSGLDFPSDLIEKVNKEFPAERDIKFALEEFFRNQGSLTPQKIIISLLNLNKGFLAGRLDEGEWERVAGIVALIIKDTEGLKTSAFLKLFKENGIMSESGWNVFKRVVGDDFTKDDIKEIYAKTVEGIETMEYVLELNSKGQMKLKSEEVQTMKNCVDNKDEILARIKSKM